MIRAGCQLDMDGGGNLYGAVPREGSTDTGIVFEVSIGGLLDSGTSTATSTAMALFHTAA